MLEGFRVRIRFGLVISSVEMRLRVFGWVYVRMHTYVYIVRIPRISIRAGGYLFAARCVCVCVYPAILASG